MYLDACIEPWAGGHRDTSMPASRRTNYAFREAGAGDAQELPERAATCVLMHGANPGLVSHFLKQALLNIAQDTGGQATGADNRRSSGRGSPCDLGVKIVQIAERDRQVGKHAQAVG